MTLPVENDSQPVSGRFPVHFFYQPPIGGAHQVFLAGDFNDWNPTATPMQENAGIYELTLMLRRGRYEYKFVVDGMWIMDDKAPEYAGDRFGGQNSVAIAGNAEDIDALRKVEFRYKPRIPVSEVCIAGTMNAWNPRRDRLQPMDDGSWGMTLLLKADEYIYKFVVDGQHWVLDPEAKLFSEDGFDGRNSLIVVDEAYPVFTRALESGVILTWGLPTDITPRMVNRVSENRVEFQVQAYHDDVDRVYLWKNGVRIPMRKVLEDGTFDYFRVIVDLEHPRETFPFCFVYTDDKTEIYLQQGTISRTFDQEKLFVFSTDQYPPFDTPEWVKEGVIYQIYPDRFFNGDLKLNQDFREWYYKGKKTPPKPGEKLAHGQEYYHFVPDWNDIDRLKSNPADPDGLPDWRCFYGGDIPGIRKKLSYLKDLGITILYLNPVFEARSNHKYDAADYRKVDPHLGTNAEFRRFVRECHHAGIRIILDVAFNHTGDTFWAFQDCVKKGPESPYYHWFDWYRWPLPDHPYEARDYYGCWWGFGSMPDLDYDRSRPSPWENPVKCIHDAQPNWDVVNYILDTAEFWLKDMGIDGFRLDVPNEVPFWFWRLFRDRVKSVKDDAWIVGEIWGNAEEWVTRETCDSVMNYAYFKDPVHRFFNMCRCSARKFDSDLKPGLITYPIQAVQCMMNLLDSHDTHRFLESAGGDISRLKLAALFQMTYIGTPHIWYGDEVGMMGGHDPDCRRPFDWDYRKSREKVELRTYYRKLIRIRRSNPCLIHGEFETLFTLGMQYAFRRMLDTEFIIVAINNEETSNTLEIDIPAYDGRLKELTGGNVYVCRDGKLNLYLKGRTGAILKPAR